MGIVTSAEIVKVVTPCPPILGVRLSARGGGRSWSVRTPGCPRFPRGLKLMSRLGHMALLLGVTGTAMAGCHHPSISAVSLNPTVTCDESWFHHHKQPEGIPFYLPKPLLIVAKNFRNIEEAKTGLTDSAPIPGYFDDQAKYADLNARTNFTNADITGAASNVNTG